MYGLRLPAVAWRWDHPHQARKLGKTVRFPYKPRHLVPRLLPWRGISAHYQKSSPNFFR